MTSYEAMVSEVGGPTKGGLMIFRIRGNGRKVAAART